MIVTLLRVHSALTLSFKGDVAQGVLAEMEEASRLRYTSTPVLEGSILLDLPLELGMYILENCNPPATRHKAGGMTWDSRLHAKTHK